MSSIRVSGNTSGYYDLTVPDVAGNNTLPINQIVATDSNGSLGSINLTGNLGIGTTSPQQLLHVNGGAGDTTIQITNSASGSAATDGFSLTVENPSSDVNIRNREASNIRFYTSNDEKLRITSDGKVGIGTESPASTLDVKGALRITRNVAAGDASEGNWVFSISHESASYYGSLYLSPSVSTGELSIMGDKFRVTQNSGVQINSDPADSTSTDNVAIKYLGTAGGHRSGYLFKDKRDNVNGAIKNNLQNDSVSNHGAHLELYSSQSGSLNRGMIIRNSGKVEFDKMPNFSTRPYYTNTELGAGAVVDFYDAHVNTGNHFNGSTNRFVAPYAGDYYFAFHSNIWKNASGILYFDWYVNGGSIVSTYGGRIYGYYYGGWENIMGFVTIPLAANDYVELRAGGGAPKVDGGAYGQFMGYALTTP